MFLMPFSFNCTTCECARLIARTLSSTRALLKPDGTSQCHLKVKFTLNEIKFNLTNFLAVILLCNTGLVASYQFQLLSNVISQCMLKKSDSYKTPQKVIIERRNVGCFRCPFHSNVPLENGRH